MSNLGPLPEAANDNMPHGRAGFHKPYGPAYTAEQMRAYAAEAVAKEREQAERGIKRWCKSFTAIVLRVLLLAPLMGLRGLFWSIGAACDKLADCTGDVERSLRPICELPHHAHFLRLLREAKAEEKRRLLEVLEHATR